MRVLFKNGTVVSGKGTRRADVLVDGEKIQRVARDIHVDDAQVVDAAGMLLMPGFIDAHTHFDLDVCNTTTADDFASGSRAALRGGTTTIVDFACPNKGETLHDGLRLWHEKADGKCACDYGFHMTIDDWNDTIESEIDDMYAEGISSFKMYMTYPAMMIGDKLMYKALKKLKEKGGICGVHCENAGVIDALIEEKKAAGEQGSVGCHPRTRPDFLEAEAVGRLLHIAEAVDIPVVIVHTTNAAALREIEAARRRGQKVYVETCPQYLVLDDSVYDNEDWLQAAKYVCAPPIRKAADRRALWQAIRRGEVQTVSTDHCSFTTAQKLAGREDFTTIPGGLPGVETRGELVYTFGVTTRKISLAAMCRVLAENPARLYGMFPRKGIIAEGADADIVVYDPAADHVIRAEDMVGAADYNPYEGVVTKGSIKQVWLRGKLAVNEGRVLAGPDGKYIRRGNAMFDQVCRELDVPFSRVGQYVCFQHGWLRPAVWCYCMWRKYHDGISDTRLISGKELLRREPNFNEKTRFAISNPDSGCVCPYGLTIAYAENAVQNGARIALNTAVLGMDVENGKITAVHTNRGTLHPALVINAAGVFAEDVAR